MQRVVTATFLFAVLFVVFLRLPAMAGMILVGLVLAVAAWEWSGFFRVEARSLRVAYTGLILMSMAFLLWFFPGQQSLRPVLWIGLIWWGVAFVWVLRYPTPIRRDIVAVCGILVLLPAWAGVLVLLDSYERGPVYVLLVMLIVSSADIGAYFIGRRFGRNKLAPGVSPGKTWEGLAGGLVGGVVAATLAAMVMDFQLFAWAMVGLSLTVISVIGDLAVSMFKRYADLKDSGGLFPGHGGVLDRIDGMTAATPLFALEAARFGIIAN